MPRAIEILLIEDNPGDVILTEANLQACKVSNRIHVVTNGAVALDFLRRKDTHKTVPRPDLILLDLNIPEKDGHEVIREVRSDPELRTIPIVVLTSSDADADIAKSYEIGANCFITKPVDLAQFERVVQAIEHFWFAVVKLPTV